MKIDETQYKLDTDIYNLLKRMVEDTPRNREIAYEREVITHSSCSIVSSSVSGEGLKIRSEDEEAAKICNGWNSKINTQSQTIYDFIDNQYRDNVVHGKGVWRILKNKDLEYKIDLARIDPKTLTYYTHSITGWNMFIQTALKLHDLPNTEREFYLRKPQNFNERTSKVYNTRKVKIWIPDRPEFVVKLSLFSITPMTSALGPCVYKLWILWFMRKLAEKHFAPFLVGKVGDMEHMPDTKPELKTQIASLAAMMKMWRNFSGVAIPGNQSIESIKMSYEATGDLLKLLNYLDEIIGQAVGLPKPMVSAKGSQISSNRTIESSFLRTIQSYRLKYGIVLKRFYEDVLLPANDINDAEVEIEWPSLRWEEILNIMGAINTAKETGVFKDFNELRRAAKAVFGWLEEVDDKDNVKFDPLISEKQAQQPFGGGGPFGQKPPGKQQLGNKDKPNKGNTGTGTPQARQTPNRQPQPQGQKSARD